MLKQLTNSEPVETESRGKLRGSLLILLWSNKKCGREPVNFVLKWRQSMCRDLGDHLKHQQSEKIWQLYNCSIRFSFCKLWWFLNWGGRLQWHSYNHITFDKIYHSSVVSIIDYWFGIWGYTQYGDGDTIQFRVIRYCLGVH